MQKIARYPALVLCLFFVIFYFSLEVLFGVENAFLRATFSTTLAFILSPRKKIIKTQTGKIKQITWLFLKEPIIIN